MRRYILLAMLLVFAGTVGVAVAKTPTRTHTCAAVITRSYKAINVQVNHISCAQVTRNIRGWIERGPKTIPLNAKKWHARRLGAGKWKISYGKKSDPSVTFTLVGISKPKPTPVPPTPTPAPPVTTTTTTPPPPSPPAAPTVSNGPQSLTNRTDATFVFADTEVGVSFMCKVDGGAFTVCGVKDHVVSYSNLADGTHTFTVEAVNAAGLTTSSVPYVWKVSTQGPPQPSLSENVTNTPNNAPSITFTFADTQAGSTFLCAVDGGLLSACNSPKPVNGLTDGAHTFAVEAQDALGNVSAVSSYAWTTDRTPPTIVTPTVPTKGQPIQAGITTKASYTCADNLDTAAQLTCQGTVANGGTLDTGSLGAKPFTVTATDRAGNVTTVDLGYTVVNNTLPVVTITSPTEKQTFAWGATATPVFTCTSTIDPAPKCVASAFSTSGAPGPGARTFTVTGTDKFGATTAKTVSYVVQPAGYYGLSFDDGPNATFTQPVLNVLAAAHATATFFLVGGNVAQGTGPALAKAEVDAGMQVGDHTWGHRAVAADVPADPKNPPVSWSICGFGQHQQTDECGTWQVEDTSDAIFSATGVRPVFFRPPFGYYDQTTVNNFAALPSQYRMTMALWTTDSLDWTGISASQIVTNVISGNVAQSVRPITAGGVILMHDAQQATVDALPTLMSRLASEQGLLPGKLAVGGTWPGPFCGPEGFSCPPPFQPDWHVQAVAP